MFFFRYEAIKLVIFTAIFFISTFFIEIILNYNINLVLLGSKIKLGDLIFNTILILLFSFFYRRLFLIFWIFISVLFHIINQYGRITQEIFTTILNTNKQESIEYLLNSVPLTDYLTIFGSILAGLFYTFYIVNPVYIKYKNTKIFPKIHVYLSIIPLFFLYIASTQVSKSLNRYFKDIIYSINFNTESTLTKKSTIKITKIHPTKYNTYVVIIGESNIKNYMSLYGYKEKTTPFLDKIPKIYIDGFIAPANNTEKAIPLYLSPSKDFKVINSENNVINLSKKAGYKTYYLSSNSHIHPNNISGSIALNSDYAFDIIGYGDFALMDKIKSALNYKDKKVVFIHIYGNHVDTCTRLKNDNYPLLYNEYPKVLNCYLSSINKVDYFINVVYNMLKESNQSFSLVYFSDHAQSIIKSTKDNNTYTIGRIFNDLQVYEVPFILISSDIKSTKKYTVLRSGLRFVDFFANWIGVETNITDNKFDIFKSKADKNIKAISFQGKVVDYKDMHYITK